MKKFQREQIRIAFVLAALVCAVAVFVLLFTTYARRFDRTMTEENYTRLEEVSGHVAAYMERAVEQQWEKMRVAVDACAALEGREERIAWLGGMAPKLGFEYIGLAGEDGLLMATGFQAPQDISEEDYFQTARSGSFFMTGIRRHIFKNRAASGLILAMPAPEGTAEVAVAMISTAKLGEDVQVDSFDGNGFSYIIDAQGEQVLHAKSVAYNNLFQTMRNLEFERGYSLDAMCADIAAHRTGMTAYTHLGVEKYAFYRPLHINDWTVVSVVSQGVVNARTAELSRALIWMCVVAVLVFLGLLSIVGVLLLRLESRRRANRAKLDFLANMSHDMRTPMNAIIGMSAIAEAHAEEPGTVRDCLEKIGFSSRHLLGLINDMLDMSRIESGKMSLAREPFSLSEVLESAENMTIPRIYAKGQDFDLRIHGVEHDSFLGDSLRLGQVFVNILTNANKFTPEGGQITVDVAEHPTADAGVARLQFVFSDTGIGMKPEFLKELFTPFCRERSSRVDRTEGSGLGMSITKQIIDLMGGDIAVESREGVGSTFTVTLPLFLDGNAPPVPQPPAWSVLLVGGGAEQGAEAVGALKAMGLSAFWVDSLEAGAGFLASTPCEAVILDRDAYAVEDLTLLESAGSARPALLLSAYDWEDIREEASQAGVCVFVQKPLLRATLSRALRQAAEGVSEPPTRQAVRFDGKRVLVAEDNEINFEIVREILSETGIEVIWAGDGAECVSCFEASPVGGIDLILMDIQMPKLNGYEAAARIRSMARPDASVPILAMSANAYAEDIAAAFASGMDGYLTKPIEMALWMAEIEKVFHQSVAKY